MLEATFASTCRRTPDFDALAILTDGIEWELWVRPRNRPLDELDDFTPYATASLRDALGAIKARNVEHESYSAFEGRGLIDEADFSTFTAESVSELLQTRFDYPEKGSN